MKILEDKVALITGVGRRRGIGFALAKALGIKGARIFATYLESYDRESGLQGKGETMDALKDELNAQGIEVTFLELNLRSADAPEKLFGEALRAYGCVDILINNACVSTHQPLRDITPEILDAHYEVNQKAPLLLCREFARRFTKETGGKIINMTSGQSISIMHEELPYTTTKAALEMMTTQLAAELRERGITVNAVDPGPTDTGWITDALRKEIEEAPQPSVINTPEEVAHVVSTFIAGEREAHTGTVLHMQQLQLKL